MSNSKIITSVGAILIFGACSKDLGKIKHLHSKCVIRRSNALYTVQMHDDTCRCDVHLLDALYTMVCRYVAPQPPRRDRFRAYRLIQGDLACQKPALLGLLSIAEGYAFL